VSTETSKTLTERPKTLTETPKTSTETPKKEIKVPKLSYAHDSRTPTMLMTETGVFRSHSIGGIETAVKAKISMGLAEKCLVTTTLQITGEDSIPLSLAPTADCSHTM
jgi:methionyl-tRNA formyltransferase